MIAKWTSTKKDFEDTLKVLRMILDKGSHNLTPVLLGQELGRLEVLIKHFPEADEPEPGHLGEEQDCFEDYDPRYER